MESEHLVENWDGQYTYMCPSNYNKDLPELGQNGKRGYHPDILMLDELRMVPTH